MAPSTATTDVGAKRPRMLSESTSEPTTSYRRGTPCGGASGNCIRHTRGTTNSVPTSDVVTATVPTEGPAGSAGEGRGELTLW